MHYHIKQLLLESIQRVAGNISEYTRKRGQLVRKRKLPPFTVLLVLISLRVKATAMELADFFDWFDPLLTWIPRQSALCQQRAKLLPSAMQDVFKHFTGALVERVAPNREARRKGKVHWQLFAVDGTNISFQNWHKPEADPWRTTKGTGKAYCAGHLTALWDVTQGIFLDGVLQPIHELDEREAFLRLIDRFKPKRGVRPVFIGDRGFPSWNVLARLKDKGFHYVIRCKDRDTKGSQIWSLTLPKTKVFDAWVTVEIVRKANRKAAASSPYDRIVMVSGERFDLLKPDSRKTYKMTFRVIRTRLADGNYECLLTNLPKTEFSAAAVVDMYARRWSEEDAFSALKCHIGFEDLHCKKPEFAEQEVWGKLTAFNFVSTVQALAEELIEVSKDAKYDYRPDFSFAVNRSLRFLIRNDDHKDEALLELLARECHPIRPGRKAPRGKPRKPGARALNHRAA